MRQELYNRLKEAIGDIDAIKHVDLWNRNVEFIEQETAWERPAVFIEFEPVHWSTIVPGVEYRAEARVRLHIITDWPSAVVDGTDGSDKLFELPDKIHEAIAGLDGENFRDLTLEESLTNHDHEDIVESIEIYSFVALKSIGR